MDFKKYSSIENTYRQKHIDKFQEVLGPDCFKDIGFTVREKLDGANIQLLFTPNQPMKVGKRTSYLNGDESFFDIWNTLAKYTQDMESFQRTADYNNVTIRLYGELYGPGINGRIDYGPDKRIALFDMYVSGKEYTAKPEYEGGVGLYAFRETENTEETLLSQQQFEAFMFNATKLHLLCPYIGLFETLEEALAVDVESLQMAGSNGSEGVVIQPYSKVLRMYNGERFILKKKSAKFEDKQDKSDDQKAQPKEKDIIYDLNKMFRGYITKNRVIDTFAKHGQIQEPKQIGTYINLILDDAKADFLKDNDLKTLVPDMERKREKDLYNVGSLIVNILKEYL